MTRSLLSRWPGGRVLAAVVGAAALAVTPLAVSAGAAPAPVGPVVAQPADAVPGGFASWNELYAYQERLNAAAERISVASGGSAGVVASPVNRELRVYWNGAVPTAVRTLAAGLGVPVVFESARYSQRLLVEQAQKMIGEPDVVVASPKADGSGLAITVDRTARTAKASELQARSPVALTVTAGEAPRAMAGRQADTPPFKGGARFSSSVGTCSTGFAIGTSTGNFMLTAGHCGANGEAITIPGQPSPTGSLQAKSQCRDTALLDLGGRVQQSAYTGQFNASTSSPVRSAAPDFVGNRVITSGAASGQHNNVEIVSVNNFIAVGGISGCSGGVGPLTGGGLPQVSPALCATAAGDSGGSVYTPAGAGTFGVIARGTITAGAGTAAQCPGTNPDGSNFVFYAPLLRPAGDTQIGSLNFHNASRPTANGASDLTGSWRGSGGGPAAFIAVAGNALTVNMSAFGRPTARGFILDATTIQVTFPDDRTYTGKIQSATSILWSNNSTWVKS